MMHYGWNPFWSGFGSWISMILFWIFIAFVVHLILKGLRGDRGSGHDENRDRPLEILKERYAKGEIDKKEFEEKKKDLK